MHIYAKATALLVAAALFLALNACAPAGRPDAKLERPLLSRQEMSRRFTEDVNWWQGYHDPALNRHIELAGILETTFRQETETDLFGEQAAQ